MRESGNLSGSAPVALIGPAGRVELKEGCILAKRHIHMRPNDAALYQVKDKEEVRVRTDGDRPVIFEKVICRVSEEYALECHLDTDEANGCGLTNGSLVRIV